jgi:peptidoglycan/LPS O-acetylase OafA/YrhL
MAALGSFLKGDEKYRPDIDGLRAIAVLSVVFCHAGFTGFTGGFVGVDIFFVISGYLITGIIWRDLRRGRFSLTEFYVRRIRRIIPALFVVLAASSIAGYFLLVPTDLVSLGGSLKSTILFYSNFHFIKQINYFDGPAAEKPLLHTWSLSVEEQFYAIWPLLFLLMARFLPAKRVLPSLLAIAAISLILAQLKLAEHPKDPFFLSYYRMWELMVGSALAIAPPILMSRGLAAALAILGFSLIAFSVGFYDPTTPFPAFTALPPCLGAALIIAAGGSSNPASKVLGLGPIRFVGLISYSLYLIHWPLLSFARLYLNDDLDVWHRLIIVLGSVLLAYLSWRFVEQPCRAPSPNFRKVFFRAAASAGALFIVAQSFVSTSGFPARVSDGVMWAENFGVKTASDVESSCVRVVLEGVKGGKACALGPQKKEGYDFVLWGDSHAQHYAAALGALADANNVSGILVFEYGCGPLLGWGPPSCRNFNASALNWIVKQESLKLVLLASRWSGHERELVRNADARTLLPGTMAALNERGLAPVILGEPPSYIQNVALCVARARYYGREVGSCTQQPAQRPWTLHKALDTYFADLGRRYAFKFVDPRNALCDAEWCHGALNGQILMRDGNHLSVEGALYLVPYLKTSLPSPITRAPVEPAESSSQNRPISSAGLPLAP